jgi:DNA mismatch endonuclease, patch repair protein
MPDFLEVKRPPASSNAIRDRMKRQARSGTRPELTLRRELWHRGLRYRVDVTPIQGLRSRADLVFSRQRVAVYVDGCYWHSCAVHATVPKANRDWWVTKLEANVKRDRDTDAQLEAAGWVVVRVWEHERVVDAADRVEVAVREKPAIRDVAAPDGTIVL